MIRYETHCKLFEKLICSLYHNSSKGLLYNKTVDELFGRNNSAANIDSWEVIEIVHLDYLAGLIRQWSIRFVYCRILEFVWRPQSVVNYSHGWLDRRALNVWTKSKNKRYLSSNSNSRFMVEQRYGNRYRIHSPKHCRYLPMNSLTLWSISRSLIVELIEPLEYIGDIFWYIIY